MYVVMTYFYWFISYQTESYRQFCTAAILLFSISQKGYATKVAAFWMIYYHILFQDSKLRGVTSQVSAPVMLLIFVGDYKIYLLRHNVRIK
jgi:hypothetical protein